MAGGTLTSVFNKGSESLANSRVGVDVTGHNISNAHTPGYSRQIVNLETKTPIASGIHIFGDGAKLQSIARAHDNFLEKQIQRETQVHGKNKTLLDGLQKLQGFFNPDLTSTIRDKMDSFSNAVRDLSSNPEEQSARINLIESGKGLTQAFNFTHSGILEIQSDSNNQIIQYSETLNQKLSEIAELNSKIREMGAGGQTSVNDLEDRQEKLIKEVGDLIDINVYKDENDQVTLRGPNESLLVEGKMSSRVTLAGSFSQHGEMPKLMVSEFDKDTFSDITEKTKKGKLGALVEIRDHHAKQLKEEINNLAQSFAHKFNEIHESGYGIHEYADKKGRSFFVGVDGPGDAAQNITIDNILFSTPNAISAAMTAKTPGDNVVANKLVKMFYEPYSDKSTFTFAETYDKVVAELGQKTAHVKDETTASQIVFDKLKAQKESFSGVSLDEEAANLLKYQHLFNASSKIITTANEMFQTVLELKR
jgi:flagellar hook-associated protein 1 FlgK